MTKKLIYVLVDSICEKIFRLVDMILITLLIEIVNSSINLSLSSFNKILNFIWFSTIMTLLQILIDYLNMYVLYTDLEKYV